jgi:hypothetical protein
MYSPDFGTYGAFMGESGFMYFTLPHVFRYGNLYLIHQLQYELDI